MPPTKSVQTIRDESPDLEARIITAIGTAGPRNVAQISRMTHAHQETIRYKIKRRFGRLGFRFHAEVDFDKLGLSLHWAAFDFTKAYYEMAPEILRALNQVGYLTYFAKVVPQGNHIALFALPRNTTDQYKEFLSGLKARGILDGFTLSEVLVSRHKAMDPRFFNFRSGQWEIEWEKVAEQAPIPLPLGNQSHLEGFDYYDLLIIKELQKDSLQHLTGIAKKLRVHQKTLEYHYRTHVQKWKLIPSYRIRWVQDTTKKLVLSTTLMRMTFHGLSASEFKDVQTTVSKIPFLWAEDLLRDGTYTATMYAPPADIIPVSSYINGSAHNLGRRVEVGFIKHDEAAFFTIPYNMYQRDGWKFDIRKMETALRAESIMPAQK